MQPRHKIFKGTENYQDCSRPKIESSHIAFPIITLNRKLVTENNVLLQVLPQRR